MTETVSHPTVDSEETSQRPPTAELVGMSIDYPLKIHYCGECTMPIEYCEYSGRFDKCRQWLERNLPEMVGDLAVSTKSAGCNDETPAAGGAGGGGEEEEGKKGHRKRGGKGQPKADKSASSAETVRPVKETTITVQRAPRGKNKSVTVIRGMAANGIDLKVASKFFASRFACGSSVTAADEIVIQGDVKDELLDVIPEKWKTIRDDLIEDLGEQKR